MMEQNISPAAVHAAKRLARLAAVQALYEASFAEQPLAAILSDTIGGGFSGLHEEGDAIIGAPDSDLFGSVANGVAKHKDELDAMIGGALDNKTPDRLEILLLTILRAGVFELHHHGKIPAGVIINDYVDVAHAFYDGKEPALVNGVLDKLAGKLRAN
ncbi:MAG: transcription antitermination factor NusB [Alphaproteobacteria bacterium]|nr:transcription antitermination factor NusB [Alphaproteobacteria bacterium]